jgi:hypothetical protein
VALQVLPGGLALEDARRTGEEPELVDHRGDLLARGERLDLPGVLGLEGDELVGTGLDGVGDLEQGLLALARRRAPPLGEGRVGGGVRRVDVGLPAHRSGRDDRSGRGVDDVGGGIGTSVGVLAGDEVAQGARTAHVCLLPRGW